jgi:hypothetical protein
MAQLSRHGPATDALIEQYRSAGQTWDDIGLLVFGLMHFGSSVRQRAFVRRLPCRLLKPAKRPLTPREIRLAAGADPLCVGHPIATAVLAEAQLAVQQGWKP